MKRDSILVLHDTNMQVYCFQAFVNNLLMSSIRGKKILPYPTEAYPYTTFGKSSFLNGIGAIQLNEDAFSSLFEVCNLLTLPWNYMPDYSDIKQFIEFLDKHYPKYYSNYFKEAVLLQEKICPNK